jgi:hypothetical protein
MGDGALPDAVGAVFDVERPAPESDPRFGDAVAVLDGDGVVAGLRGQLLRKSVGCLGHGVATISQPRHRATKDSRPRRREGRPTCVPRASRRRVRRGVPPDRLLCRICPSHIPPPLPSISARPADAFAITVQPPGMHQRREDHCEVQARRALTAIHAAKIAHRPPGSPSPAGISGRDTGVLPRISRRRSSTFVQTPSASATNFAACPWRAR